MEGPPMNMESFKLQKPPTTLAEHITRAKQERAGGDHTAAQTFALIAIAEHLGEIAQHLRPVEVAVDVERTPIVSWPGAR
ncbi:hypothetical protein ABQF44_27200 [Mycolicibacterium porcinum]